MMMINGTPRQAGWRRRKASETGLENGGFVGISVSSFLWTLEEEKGWRARPWNGKPKQQLQILPGPCLGFWFFLGNDVRWPMALLAAAVSSQMGGYLACYIELRRKGLLRSCWVDAWMLLLLCTLFFSFLVFDRCLALRWCLCLGHGNEDKEGVEGWHGHTLQNCRPSGFWRLDHGARTEEM
jgi:hypothetical protein